MRQIFDQETAFKVVSALIVIILGTQFALVFINTGRWGWPMVSYPMYSVARYDGDRMDDFRAYAALKDGTKIEVDPDELGMGYWIFLKNVLNPLLITNGYYQRNTAARRLRAESEPGTGDGLSSANVRAELIAKLAPVIDRYCDRSKGALARLEVWDKGIAISPHGPVDLGPELAAATDVTCE